jgi:hypothetical protein
VSVTVYVWRMSTSDPIGHSSIKVANTYMSYWPNDPAGKKDFKIGSTHDSAFAERYETDRRLEKRQADQSVDLRGLDESRMLEAWRQIVQNKVAYNMVRHNCSTVVASLLEVGSGIPPDFEPRLKAEEIGDPKLRLMLRLRFLAAHVNMWTPNELHRYALRIQAARSRG